jgi:hypothetical protein
MAQRTQVNRIIELGVSHRQMDEHLLHDAVVVLAQERARARVAAAAPVALTDSSGGTAAGLPFALAAVVTPTKGIVDGVSAIFSPKAGFDTATTAIQDAHKELAAKTQEFLTLIASASGPSFVMTAGAAADNTIAAITSALTAGATATLDAATGIAQITRARNVQAELASAINWCRVAMGLLPIPDNSGGIFTRNHTGWNADNDVRAATASSPANGDASLTDATVDAALGALRNNIATMAAALNQMRGTLAIGPFVVATSNARTRLRDADVTV